MFRWEAEEVDLSSDLSSRPLGYPKQNTPKHSTRSEVDDTAGGQKAHINQLLLFYLAGPCLVWYHKAGLWLASREPSHKHQQKKNQ